MKRQKRKTAKPAKRTAKRRKPTKPVPEPINPETWVPDVYVAGRWMKTVDAVIQLVAVHVRDQNQPGEIRTSTSDTRSMLAWRSRQAAHQWLRKHNVKDCTVIKFPGEA